MKINVASLLGQFQRFQVWLWLLHRCYVSYSKGKWKCHHKECETASEGRERSYYHESTTLPPECVHIGRVNEFVSHTPPTSEGSNQLQQIYLSSDVLKEVPFPPAVSAEFEGQVINGNSNKLIHRVSDQCFVVQTTPSSEAPLGLLHVRVDAKKQFQCSCHKFRRMTSLCGATTAPKVSKRCVHVYLCLWAVFSSDLLKNEFSMFLFDGVLAEMLFDNTYCYHFNY